MLNKRWTTLSSLRDWPFYFHSIFFFNDPATPEIYTLSLHDALPIFKKVTLFLVSCGFGELLTIIASMAVGLPRSEAHTSELQSHSDIVCRLLLEKKKRTTYISRRSRGKKEGASINGHESAYSVRRWIVQSYM